MDNDEQAYHHDQELFHQQAEEALRAALYRPLTNTEQHLLAYLAGIQVNQEMRK